MLFLPRSEWEICTIHTPSPSLFLNAFLSLSNIAVNIFTSQQFVFFFSSFFSFWQITNGLCGAVSGLTMRKITQWKFSRHTHFVFSKIVAAGEKTNRMRTSRAWRHRETAATDKINKQNDKHIEETGSHYGWTASSRGCQNSSPSYALVRAAPLRRRILCKLP